MLVSSYNPHIQQVRVHGSPWNSAFSASFGFWQEPQSTYICRVQSCVWRLPKYWPHNPLSTQRMCPPPAPKAVHNGRAVRGWGVNILEDARHRIGLLQYNLSTARTEMGLCYVLYVYDIMGGEGEVIFPGILPTQRRHFSHEFGPLPPPPSQCPNSERNSIMPCVVKSIYRSLSRYQSCRFRYLFWQKLIFTLQIEDCIFLNLYSESSHKNVNIHYEHSATNLQSWCATWASVLVYWANFRYKIMLYI